MSDANEREESEHAEPGPDETRDLSSPGSAKRIRNKVQRELAEASAFWRKVFNDPVGRREMWAILRRTHAFEDRFACTPAGFQHDQSTWFQAGEKAVGQGLYHDWLRMARDGVNMMLDEHDPRFKAPKKTKAAK